jgi:hypothetical protein
VDIRTTSLQWIKQIHNVKVKREKSICWLNYKIVYKLSTYFLHTIVITLWLKPTIVITLWLCEALTTNYLQSSTGKASPGGSTLQCSIFNSIEPRDSNFINKQTQCMHSAKSTCDRIMELDQFHVYHSSLEFLAIPNLRLREQLQ